MTRLDNPCCSTVMAEQFALMTLLAKIDAEDKLLKRAKETHREKSRGYLKDLKECGHDKRDLQRRQCKDFNDWYTMRGGRQLGAKEWITLEQAAYDKLVLEDNPYLRNWMATLSWNVVEMNPFCKPCGLWHDKVKWCKECTA